MFGVDPPWADPAWEPWVDPALDWVDGEALPVPLLPPMPCGGGRIPEAERGCGTGWEVERGPAGAAPTSAFMDSCLPTAPASEADGIPWTPIDLGELCACSRVGPTPCTMLGCIL